MELKDILAAVEEKRIEQQKKHPSIKILPIDDNDTKILKQYFFANEMMNTMLIKIGDLGLALEGDRELTKELIEISTLCICWLEQIKKPL